MLVHFSCNDCARIRCEGYQYPIEIRLMHNGKNAVFGLDAFIDRDSIRLFVPNNNYPDTEFAITFSDSAQSIRLSLDVLPAQFLAFPGSIDTLVGNYLITNPTECCARHNLVSVLWNDKELCKDGCEEVINIEI
jgi:hypothetical protein